MNIVQPKQCCDEKSAVVDRVDGRGSSFITDDKVIVKHIESVTTSTLPDDCNNDPYRYNIAIQSNTNDSLIESTNSIVLVLHTCKSVYL